MYLIWILVCICVLDMNIGLLYVRVLEWWLLSDLVVFLLDMDPKGGIFQCGYGDEHPVASYFEGFWQPRAQLDSCHTIKAEFINTFRPFAWPRLARQRILASVLNLEVKFWCFLKQPTAPLLQLHQFPAIFVCFCTPQLRAFPPFPPVLAPALFAEKNPTAVPAPASREFFRANYGTRSPGGTTTGDGRYALWHGTWYRAEGGGLDPGCHWDGTWVGRVGLMNLMVPVVFLSCSILPEITTS